MIIRKYGLIILLSLFIIPIITTGNPSTLKTLISSRIKKSVEVKYSGLALDLVLLLLRKIGVEVLHFPFKIAYYRFG